MTLKNYQGSKFKFAENGQIWQKSSLVKGDLIGCNVNYGKHVFFDKNAFIIPVSSNWEK